MKTKSERIINIVCNIVLCLLIAGFMAYVFYYGLRAHNQRLDERAAIRDGHAIEVIP